MSSQQIFYKKSANFGYCPNFCENFSKSITVVPDKGRWLCGEREKLFFTRKAERRLRYSFPRLVQPQPLAKAEPLSPFQEKRKTLFNYMLPTHVGNRA